MLSNVAGSSYPTTKCPQRLALLLQHDSVLEIGQRFKAGQPIQSSLLPSILSFPKPPKLP